MKRRVKCGVVKQNAPARVGQESSIELRCSGAFAVTYHRIILKSQNRGISRALREGPLKIMVSNPRLQAGPPKTQFLCLRGVSHHSRGCRSRRGLFRAHHTLGQNLFPKSQPGLSQRSFMLFFGCYPFCPSICPPAHPSIHSPCPSIFPPLHPPVHPSIYPLDHPALFPSHTNP